MQQADFSERLASLLAAYPTVLPRHLELEVLGTSALADITQVSTVMQACRALGVHFALDDFGTGYSSLTYLKHLPAELLKIDQSFVCDMPDHPDDLAIVEGVIGPATAFRRKVIAEGVETVAHGKLLLTLGCALAQGYGIARPMPAGDIPAWVNTWRPDPAWAAWRERALNRDDLTVVFSEVGHRYWLRSLEAYLAGQVGHPPMMGVADCHFGRWQASEGESRFGHLPLFHELVVLHNCIHATGQALVGQFSAGQVAKAQTGLDKLRPLATQMNRTLRELLYGSDDAAASERVL